MHYNHLLVIKAAHPYISETLGQYSEYSRCSVYNLLVKVNNNYDDEGRKAVGRAVWIKSSGAQRKGEAGDKTIKV